MGTALRHASTQPVVLAPLLAIAFVLTDIRLPGVVTNSFKLLDSTVGGISLFASGIILQSQSPQFSLSAAVSTVMRLLAIPVLALGLATAPMQVILSSRYKTDEKENASVLLYSPALSLALAIFGLLSDLSRL